MLTSRTPNPTRTPSPHLSLDDVRAHKWYTGFYVGPPEHDHEEIATTAKIEPLILEEMRQHGAIPEELEKALRKKDRTALTCYYHLLQRKRAKTPWHERTTATRARHDSHEWMPGESTKSAQDEISETLQEIAKNSVSTRPGKKKAGSDGGSSLPPVKGAASAAAAPIAEAAAAGSSDSSDSSATTTSSAQPRPPGGEAGGTGSEGGRKEKAKYNKKRRGRGRSEDGYSKPRPGSFCVTKPGAHEHSHTHARGRNTRHNHGVRQPSISHAHLDDPAEALKEIEIVLMTLPITYEKKGKLMLRCLTKNREIEFYLRIRKAHSDDGDHYTLKVDRVKGSFIQYKKIARHVLEECAHVLKLHHIEREDTGKSMGSVVAEDTVSAKERSMSDAVAAATVSSMPGSRRNSAKLKELKLDKASSQKRIQQIEATVQAHARKEARRVSVEANGS